MKQKESNQYSFDQHDQMIHGGQTNIAGNVSVHNQLGTHDFRNQRNHQYLRQSVRGFWINGVLNQSLYDELQIQLALDKHLNAVNNRPWAFTLRDLRQPDNTTHDNKTIVEFFDEMNQRLLILGSPGAGKTITLLILADELLSRAEADPTLPTPVVLNLSSWTKKTTSIEKWIVDELLERYNIPKGIADNWIKNDELLLLFDGLDEVAESRRSACVGAINDFLNEHLMNVAVCSRITEYEAFNQKLNLIGAVMIQPLSLSQINQFLISIGPQMDGLRDVLAENEALRRLANTPLMLSIMMFAYHGHGCNDNFKDNTNRSEYQNLFDRYIRRMFEHRELDYLYRCDDTIKWLRWLATQMRDYSQTLFLIEQLPPYWLNGTLQLNLYRLIVGLTIGLPFGIIVVAITEWVSGLAAGLLSGVLLTLNPKISPHGSLDVDLESALANSLVGGAIMAIFGGLFMSISEGLPNGLLIGLGGGCMMGLMIGVLHGLFPGLLDSPDQLPEDESTLQPNQGIRLSLINGLTFGVMRGLIFGPFFGWMVAIVYERINGVELQPMLELSIGKDLAIFTSISFGLFIWITGGLNICIRHFILRLLFYLHGHMPWNYARFLDYAAKRLFLRKVGGGYMFIHRLLMEHIASLTDKDIERITSGLSTSKG